MGTTRMSRDPRRGVVDEHCRVHGVENLFIAGSSVFPTSGAGTPTLTIVALALRLADRLIGVRRLLSRSEGRGEREEGRRGEGRRGE
jgi:choline dehydrogenase-like flavoprotein